MLVRVWIAGILIMVVPMALPAANIQKDVAQAEQAIAAKQYDAALTMLTEITSEIQQRMSGPPAPNLRLEAMMVATRPDPQPLEFTQAIPAAYSRKDYDRAWVNAYSAMAAVAAIIHAQPARPRHLATAAKGMAANSPVLMHSAAKLALESGDTADAYGDVQQEIAMLRTTPLGSALDDIHWHRAQSLLGQIYLAQGDLVRAKEALLASVAGKSGRGMKVSASWGSMGPGMKLAQGLLAAGSNAEVLKYLETCRTIQWDGAAEVAGWYSDLAAGRTPAFSKLSLAF